MKLQKVLNQTADDFYAHEVFEIAKSQNMKLIDAFEQYKNNYLRSYTISEHERSDTINTANSSSTSMAITSDQ